MWKGVDIDDEAEAVEKVSPYVKQCPYCWDSFHTLGLTKHKCFMKPPQEDEWAATRLDKGPQILNEGEKVYVVMNEKATMYTVTSKHMQPGDCNPNGD